MNRFLPFCCACAIGLTSAALHAEAPSNNAANPKTIVTTEAPAQPTQLPGGRFGNQRNGLIKSTNDNGEFCGDPSAGSCGGVDSADAKPATDTKDEGDSDQQKN